ncbi:MULTISPECIES: PilZ domain-containing protein [Bradyrhizobium]|uniref:PilZ domain-containing protein n=1 Tax=Bradyrhizobium TaxID=374 RepID=UPI0004225C55|nr:MULTISPECIES: PilZ domain-containing protein [Bradyrhizobium]WLB85708.1 PilZ domain-containing protein [Bradyrhizobium japonicum USDA 135]GLR94849.1 pilus assembly protein PilZ [Bradyrhizobium liaoningense]
MSVEEFLRQRAVDVAVSGSYSLSRWYDCEGKLRSFACRTKRVSPFRMIVDVPVVGKVGERVTSYFQDFGEFQCTISATLKAGFLMELDMTRARRAWMSEKLTWLEKKQKDASVRELRRDARFVPQVSHTVLTLADGSTHSCFIIDVSTAGVAVSSEYDPPVGTPLAVGACVGRVIRKFAHGFAVKFAEKQSRDDLVRLIVRSSQPA